jgi:hypothetical protein
MVRTISSMMLLRLRPPRVFPWRWPCLGLWLTLTLPSTVAADEPPPPLACLARYYGVTVEHDDAGWWARVPPATRIPWDDRTPKSADERLAHPDVHDAFVPTYRSGPIRAVTTPGDDPGRARLDAMLRAAYPRRDLVRVPFVGHRVEIHAKVAPALARVAARLERAIAADPSLRPFVARLGGTVNERAIAGTDRPSAHSWGIAIDLDPARGDYWRWRRGGWRNRVPQAIVDAFEAEGFIWGGRWYHFDTMHFEYRPELLDPTCRSGETSR